MLARQRMRFWEHSYAYGVRGLVQTALAVKCVLVCDIRLINIVIERSCTLSRLSSECVWYQPNKRYTFTPFILLHPFAVSGCFQGFGAQLHRRPAACGEIMKKCWESSRMSLQQDPCLWRRLRMVDQSRDLCKASEFTGLLKAKVCNWKTTHSQFINMWISLKQPFSRNATAPVTST